MLRKVKTWFCFSKYSFKIGRISAKRNYRQVGKMGCALEGCIRNKGKVGVIPFEEMEKRDFTFYQTKLSANCMRFSWVVSMGKAHCEQGSWVKADHEWVRQQLCHRWSHWCFIIPIHSYGPCLMRTPLLAHPSLVPFSRNTSNYISK